VFLLGAALLSFHSPARGAETMATPELSSVATQRFVAVHGRRSVVMGYPETGLEIWAYPLQILSGYQIGFRADGATTETDGRLLLRRIIERPDSVTRIYAGPNYVIRETLFVPLDQPAAILSYEVESDQPVSIDVHFTPVLNLMWPGALGGQSTGWSAEAPGFVLEEPLHHLRAVVASPEMASHDPTVNSTLRSDQLSFSIEPHRPSASAPDAPAKARVYVELLNSPDEDAAASVHSFEKDAAALQVEAILHYDRLAQNAIRISTPDDEVNSALAWSEIALDQAWVCNPQLGCGLVAGYGPSRGARRPQYAWFFAGDGLVATNALVSAGEYTRARDELLFIAKYQDAKTGMIWHELSQSAGYIDWPAYPYMFVHVDISFDYLNAVARYVSASGDAKFAVSDWPSIEAAYRYCASLMGPDGLPHIPAGKEGGDEQHRPVEDLGLSTSWISATRSFAALARAAGYPQLADEALEQNRRARQAVAAHFWDAAHNFWIDGYTAQGAPIFTRHGGPSDALLENIFTPRQNETILDQLASSAFQTDWGTRSVATDSSIYDPWSYATGSVFALHAESTAAMFWLEDRPDAAWPLWRSIVPWSHLDSLGHIHEVLAGNYYREQTESVPEQTWSSAGLLDAAMRGLLGIKVDGIANSIAFRPHLPAQWDHVSIANLRLPHANLSLKMKQSIDSVVLEIENDGTPVGLLFEPEVPHGARIAGSLFDGHAATAVLRQMNEDEHASVQLNVPAGRSDYELRFTGGVSLLLPHRDQGIGDPSTAMKVTNVSLQNGALSITADVNSAAANVFEVRTPWPVAAVEGASMQTLPDHLYSIDIKAPGTAGYSAATVRIRFAKDSMPAGSGNE
jgi:glycogen debranching enzyme